MLIGVLLAINIVVCLGLIGVVLLQRSEGGALGMGGGSSSFMTARGAGDLLTRITWILFSIFLLISLALTILTGRANTGASVADQVKGLDSKTLNAPAVPQAPPPGSLNSLPQNDQPATSQPGAIQAPTPQINTPAPATSQPSLLAPAEPAKKPAPAAKAPATAPAATPTVPAPAAEQPKP